MAPSYCLRRASVSTTPRPRTNCLDEDCNPGGIAVAAPAFSLVDLLKMVNWRLHFVHWLLGRTALGAKKPRPRTNQCVERQKQPSRSCRPSEMHAALGKRKAQKTTTKSKTQKASDANPPSQDSSPLGKTDHREKTIRSLE